MKQDRHVSPSVINRLPRYYRFLRDLLGRGVTRISSKELAELMNVTASQIRQDLNCFGGFGQQGYGYNVELLHKEIGSILGVDRLTPAVLIGAGNLGKTLANQVNLSTRGFRLIGAFDKSPAIIGTDLVGLTVQNIDSLEAFCRRYNPKAAIICIPKEAAAAMAPGDQVPGHGRGPDLLGHCGLLEFFLLRLYPKSPGRYRRQRAPGGFGDDPVLSD